MEDKILILADFNIPNTKWEYSEATDSIVPKGATPTKMNVFLQDIFSLGLSNEYNR